MELTHNITNGVCIVEVSGNLALDGVSDVKSFIKPFLADLTITGVIFNCQKIEFIDSSGIGLIVSIFKSLKQRNADFALCHLGQKNHEIFKLTRLDSILKIVGSEEEALSTF